MTENACLFEKLNIISPISKESFRALNNCFVPKSFPKGSYLLLPGAIQKDLYLINQGVQMAFFENSKKMHVLAFTYTMDFCAVPQSFLLQTPSEYAVQCLTETQVFALNYDSLQHLFENHRAIETLFRKMMEWLLIGTLARQFELQTQSMEERFRTFCTRSPHLLQLVPQKHLASYLSIDPTNFSKLINSIRI